MKIILTESQFNEVVKAALSEEIGHMPVPKRANKPYSIDPDKVLIVKKFLDKGFRKGNYDTIGPDGMPKRMRIVVMLSDGGDVLKNMYPSQLCDLLVDRFQRMFTDGVEREMFMKRVVADWMDDRIGTFGTLSVNHL